MEIFKEASAVGTGAPDAAELEKINRYSKTPLTAEQVYRFQVRLCDDQPDRDLERFDRASLPRLRSFSAARPAFSTTNGRQRGRSRASMTPRCARRGMRLGSSPRATCCARRRTPI